MNDQRVLDLIEAYREAERYAAKLELAAERVKVLCRVGIRASASTGLSHEEAVALLHLIGQLAEVKDDRSRIFIEAADAPNEQG